MKKVASSEFHLLSLARRILGEGAPDQSIFLLGDSRKPIDKMGPDCAACLQDILSKGVVHRLLREGGWQKTRHFSGKGVKTGRAWERFTPELDFTENSFLLLKWALSEPLKSTRKPFGIAGKSEIEFIKSGDLILLYYTADLLTRTGFSETLGRMDIFYNNPLIWLGFTDVLSEFRKPDRDRLLQGLELICKGPGAQLLELLQMDLARRWRRIQYSKPEIHSPTRMQSLGDAETIVLESFAQAAQNSGRRDLVGFIYRSAAHVLGEEDAGIFVRSLDSNTSLAVRQNAIKAACAFLNSLEIYQKWMVEARNTPFFEDGYEQRQLLLKQWESLGTENYQKSRTFVERLTSLQSLTGVGSR